MTEVSLSRPLAFVLAGVVAVVLTFVAHARAGRGGFWGAWARHFPRRLHVVVVWLAGSAVFVAAWAAGRYGLVDLRRDAVLGILVVLLVAMIALTAGVLGARIRKLEERISRTDEDEA